MIWFLRVGILMQFLGAISLSAPLVFIFVKEETFGGWLEYFKNTLNDFLRLSLDKVYGQVRFRKVSPDASKYEKIKQTYIALGITLAIAVFGYMVLAFFTVAIMAHSVGVIIGLASFAVAFAMLLGWVFSKAYNNRVLKVMVFILSAVASPLIYGILIFSAIFHILLLSIIGCIALFHSLLVRLAREKVRKVMLVLGGLLLAIGMALQFASTFMDIY